MIKINLLPPEKRKAERTPLPRFGLMMADAAVLGVVLILVIISYIQILNTEKEIEVKKSELAELQPFVQKHDKLQRDLAVLKGELEALGKITGLRPFQWWQVLDYIWDTVEDNKRVWLDSMEVADGRQMGSKLKALDPDSKDNPAYGVVLRCHVGGLDVKGMTNFRMALKNHPELKKLFPIVNFDTQWTVADQKDFVEKYSLDFEVILVNTGQTDKSPQPVPVGNVKP